MDTRVNLMAAGIIAGFILLAAGSLLVGWLHARRLDQFPTLFPAFFGLIAAAVLAMLYMSMTDRRGIVFFGVFVGLILLPWVAALFIFGPDAWKYSERAGDAPLTEEAAPAINDIAAGIVDAVEATLANYSDGTSVSTIRYTEPAVAAARMKAEYGGTLPPFTQVAGRSGVLVEGGGIALFRFQDGARLVCVTGANRNALERRLKRPLPGAPQEAGPVKPTQKSTVAAVIGGVLVYTVFVAWVFVRLSTWAASSRPVAGVEPLPAEALRDRLLDIARQDVPFTVRQGDRPDELIAEWRYADATWLDQMSAHKLKRLIRYRLRLDPAHRIVRVLEYRTAFDATAGFGGASLSYEAQRGITFFEVQHNTLLGLQMKNGRITPEVSYSWHFSVDELRNPLIQTVTGGGWTWRQVMLDAPWLTG